MTPNVAAATAAQLALLISGPLSARLLGPTDRGYLAFLTLWPSVVVQIGALGIALASTYYLASGRIDGRTLVRRLRGPVLLQVAILTGVNACIVLAYVDVTGAPILTAALITLLSVPAVLAIDYGIAFTLGARRYGFGGALRVTGPLCGALGLLLLTILGADDLTSVAITQTASYLLAAGAASAVGLHFVRRVRRSPSREGQDAPRAAEVLAFGRRGYVGYLSPTDGLRVDQIVVAVFLSPTALGYYVVGSAFSTLTKAIAANVGLSSAAEVAQHADPAVRRRMITRRLVLMAALLSALTCLLGAAAIVMIPLLFGQRFRASVPIAEWLLLASLFLALKRIAVDLARGAGETRAATRAEVVNLLAFACLCVPGLSWGGATGVAASLAIASLAGLVYLSHALRGVDLLTSRRVELDQPHD